MPRKPAAVPTHWTCPHGFVTGFFPVPGKPHLIEHRSCGICCDEISEQLKQVPLTQRQREHIADGVSEDK